MKRCIARSVGALDELYLAYRVAKRVLAQSIVDLYAAIPQLDSWIPFTWIQPVVTLQDHKTSDRSPTLLLRLMCTLAPATWNIDPSEYHFIAAFLSPWNRLTAHLYFSALRDELLRRAFTAFVVARTRCLDQWYRDAITHRGVKQILIIGAGYDTRSYRFEALRRLPHYSPRQVSHTPSNTLLPSQLDQGTGYAEDHALLSFPWNMSKERSRIIRPSTQTSSLAPLTLSSPTSRPTSPYDDGLVLSASSPRDVASSDNTMPATNRSLRKATRSWTDGEPRQRFEDSPIKHVSPGGIELQKNNVNSTLNRPIRPVFSTSLCVNNQLEQQNIPDQLSRLLSPSAAQSLTSSIPPPLSLLTHSPPVTPIIPTHVNVLEIDRPDIQAHKMNSLIQHFGHAETLRLTQGVRYLPCNLEHPTNLQDLLLGHMSPVSQDTLVLLEDVLCYLSPQAVHTLLTTLHTVWSNTFLNSSSTTPGEDTATSSASPTNSKHSYEKHSYVPDELSATPFSPTCHRSVPKWYILFDYYTDLFLQRPTSNLTRRTFANASWNIRSGLPADPRQLATLLRLYQLQVCRVWDTPTLTHTFCNEAPELVMDPAYQQPNWVRLAECTFDPRMLPWPAS